MTDRFDTTGHRESDDSTEARLARALETVGDIVGALHCPYYSGTGSKVCNQGCQPGDGPRCHEAGDPHGLGPAVVGLLVVLEDLDPGYLQRAADAVNRAYVEDGRKLCPECRRERAGVSKGCRLCARRRPELYRHNYGVFRSTSVQVTS